MIKGAVFGRTVAHAGGEWRQWLQPIRGIVGIAPAVFVDSARAWRGLTEADGRLHIDAGVGLRVAIPGAGLLRIDAARGLRDGAGALSIGWTR